MYASQFPEAKWFTDEFPFPVVLFAFVGSLFVFWFIAVSIKVFRGE